MLIKIVYGSDDNQGTGYLSERHIDFVREMPDGKWWRVHSLGDTWFLSKDKNEPFKIWLSQQIGGDAWQCDREWRKKHGWNLLDATLEAMRDSRQAIEKVEQCQISIT